MKAYFNKTINSFIPDYDAKNQIEVRTDRIRIMSFLIGSLCFFGYVPEALRIGLDYQAYVNLGAGVVTFGCAFLYRFKVNVNFILWLFLSSLIFTIYIQLFCKDGLHDPLAPTLVYTPIIALLLGSKRDAIIFLALTVVLIFVLFVFEKYNIPRPNWGADMVKTEAQLAALLVMIVALYIAVNIFDNEKNNALNELRHSNNELAQEKLNSEKLLNNILPIEVANELKQTGRYLPRRFDDVTVLFTDFVDFTGVSEQMEPEELVGEIDAYFKEFDLICDQFGLEKIKTIGDAYLAVRGLGGSDPSENTVRVATAAIRMLDLVKQHNQERRLLGKPYFEIRMGMHAGPVVAGIVGVRKFAYDIWGDTVNIAARMEQNSQASCINVSERIYERLNNHSIFKLVPRGDFPVKGKGLQKMYFVEAESAEITSILT